MKGEQLMILEGEICDIFEGTIPNSSGGIVRNHGNHHFLRVSQE
jgi:hypothetical protein